MINDPKKVPPGTKRSSHWPKVRRDFLGKNPKCAACGGTKKLEAHHVMPFHLDPSKELDPTNLIALCESNPTFNCHLVVGHRLNFRDVNQNSRRDAAFLWDNYFREKAVKKAMKGKR
jgi:5-methylcytosine-specific restriction protein A